MTFHISGYEIAALVILVLLAAFFAASEAALVAVSRLRARTMVERGLKRARAVLALTEDDFAQMASLGFNTVRLIVSWSSLEPAPGHIDAAYLARATQANVASLATLALGPAPPANVQLVTKRLGYDSTLRWQPAADAVSYEIVWRSSDAPQWQHARNVGGDTEGTVPVSKDDDVLGVRSVDANGLRSPAVYPVPVRE